MNLDQFIDSLKTSRLMNADQIASFLDRLPQEDRPESTDELARTLVERKKLTKYQADMLLQGKIQGLVFGNYHVLDKLGEGGMGVVYLARHQRMHRTVALKVLTAEAVRSPEAVQRFHREVAAAARLVHPNIVTAYDADEDDGIHYLVMEYVDGRNLAQIVKESGPLPLALALSCIYQAARGLEYAHSEGLIHRDIKPHNLLLDKRGIVKILDLGLARFQKGSVAAEGEEGVGVGTLSHTGTVMGTVHFMAPEQAEDIKRTDHRADIYSLGCTFYYVVTGQFVYPRDTVIKVILAHRDAEIPSIRAGCPEANEQIEQVFRRMVAKRTHDRFQTMREVVDAIDHCGVRFRADLGAAPFPAPGVPAEVSGPSRGATAAVIDSAPAAVVGPSVPGLEATSTGGPGLAPTVLPTRMAGSAALPPGGILTASAVPIVSTAPEPPSREVEAATDSPTPLPRFLQKALEQRETSAATPTAVDADSKVDSELRVLRGQVSDAFQTFKRRRTRAVIIAFLLTCGIVAALWWIPANFLTVAPSPVPPFERDHARKLQDFWAERIKTPVSLRNSIGMELVLIPPTRFNIPSFQRDQMQEDAPRVIDIPAPFYIGATEVTVGQFRQFVESTGYRTAAENAGRALVFDLTRQDWIATSGYSWQKTLYELSDDHPVVHCTVNDVTRFCEWLSQKENKRYRLPKETEWEHACRAGTLTRWSSGDQSGTLTEIAWLYSKDASGAVSLAAHPVAKKQPNNFGLYDMHGNVWELCLAVPSLPAGATRTTGGLPIPNVVYRGGAFISPEPTDARSAARFALDRNENFSIGFRVVQEIEDKQTTASPEKSEPSAETTE